MNNLIADIIDRVETCIPELKDKIQMGAVDEETSTPYATIKHTQIPIITKQGIAGYRWELDVSVFHSTMDEEEVLKDKIINFLDGFNSGEKKVRFQNAAYEFYHEYNIHGYSLTFKIV